MIEERKKTLHVDAKDKDPNKCSDIIEALYLDSLKSEKNDEDVEYTDTELFEELSTFLIAGTDSTAGLLQMIIYYLGENPHVEQKLRNIVNEIIKSDSDITYENLKKLTYIEWIQL